GGPAIVQSLPNFWDLIDEQQVFILGLDAPAKPETIVKNAWCSVSGINEPIPVQIVTGEKRRQLLEVRKDFMEQYFRGIVKFAGHTLELVFGIPVAGSDQEKFLKLRDGANSPIVVLQCQRPFPNEAEVKLVWGAGIESTSGIPTSEQQALPFKVRPAFSAMFHCERTNKDAQCIPVLPMTLSFTAPIKVEDAKRVRLMQGKQAIKPSITEDSEKGGFVQSLSFNPPFPPSTEFRLELPANLRDDAGRVLNNAARYPLSVRTDEDPPLVKFASSFGILERNAQPAIAVTVRNVEAELAATSSSIRPGAAPVISGNMTQLNRPQDIIAWMRRLHSVNSGEPGRNSVFNSGDAFKEFKLPKPGGERAFEVIGIPLQSPGFHVVELASPRLGAALLRDPQSDEDSNGGGGESKKEGTFGQMLTAVKNKITGADKKIYYVQSAALVTNLSAHFKQGRESSLVWVTSLDKGDPVPNADVAVRDCNGRAYWQGKTNTQGIARIAQELPSRDSLPGCLNNWDHQYFVTAKLNDDFTFVLSDWNEGISSWRFNLPQGDRHNAGLMHAVLDRMLFRAGETAHMKLIARRHTSTGVFLPAGNITDGKLVIQHQGSEQEYEIPLNWDDGGIAVADFAIPQEAKQGTYVLQFRRGKGRYGGETIGSFRVEAYRVPTMRATLQGPAKAQVNASAVDVDVQINYLAGGAAGMLPVKLRSQVMPKGVFFADYDGFVFANGAVKAGKEEARNDTTYNRGGEDDEEESAPQQDDGTASGQTKTLKAQSFSLDAAGAARANIAGLPHSETPQDLLAEVEYRDANGETLTSSTRIALWPSAVVVGIKPDGWVSSKDHLKFQLLALDLAGKPVAGTDVKVDVLQREYYSHRRRLIGGFYAYEHGSEVKLIKAG
ncbi:MAG TPA: MG2 domain-containing protein, partial [Gallionellaceae bacterium]|nr:MG2 domain-containing protein [Gallionellaceae bacterium]